ncbi:MAG: 16S rRNA (cytosine(1402)-N(4))-methyltransferase RsmH [Propionibacteriaceae bacterium]|jgi:16S rRNA (cytosine1402-N4)-methyltransferase|nr:16S rRNA (cytosine(1402)-N(4))-methyltransferase RsmH [Propionibacteriaceae bacterium]
MTDPVHIPVLLDRIIALMAPALDVPGAVVVDATLGLGGHARALLEACPGARLIGLDRDAAALDLARTRLAPFAERVRFIETVYDHLAEAVAETGWGPVRGVLFDLGLSSLQIDDPARGFSYSHDAPLDMRMSPQAGGMTAADVVATYDQGELIRVLRQYGDERFAARIAAAIVAARAKTPIATSAQLVEIVTAAIPVAAARTGGHPAKRTFQALRMEVNDERGALVRALPQALDLIAPGGRLVVMSYHSGEDRLVKKVLTAATSDAVPHGLAVVPDHRRARFHWLTRGAEQADEAEVAANPRSASVRVRAVERHEESPGAVRGQ